MTEKGGTFVAIGKIGRAKGLKGELRLDLFNPTSDLLNSIEKVRVGFDEESAQELSLENARTEGSRTIIRFANIATRDEASALTGSLVYASRSDFPALKSGEYYCSDLIGFEVQRETGEILGTLQQIMPTVSNDIYVLNGPAGEVLIPVTNDVGIRVNIESKTIVVTLPEAFDAI